MALNSSKEPRQTKKGLLRFQNLGSAWAVLSLPASDRNQTACRGRFGPPKALEKFVMDRREFVNKGVLAALAGGAGSTVSTARANEPGTNPTRKSVKEFGAIGDGRTDDSAAVEKALASNTGTLVFERGIYKLGRTIVIDLSKRGWTSIDGTGGARVLMAAAGPAFHFIGTHRGTAEPDSISKLTWNSERLPLVQNIEILGGHENAVGLRLERTLQATLSAVLIRNCSTGIHLVKRNRNLIISHCHIYRNRKVGIHFDKVDLHQAIICSNHISYNPVAGIWLDGGGMRNFQFVGNDIEYNHDKELRDCADLLIDMRPEGSSFREGTIAGNTIQARPTPGGANVRVLGGKGLLTGGLLAITGNLIGSQTTLLDLADCRGVSISGNSLYSGMERTLAAKRCANLVFSGNSIDWNPGHREKNHDDGIRISDCDGVNLSATILENSFQGKENRGGAIEVIGSRDVSISDCQVLDPRHRGIWLENTTRCRVSDCTVIDRRKKKTMKASIELAGECQDNIISGNFISKDSLAVADKAGLFRDNLEV